MRLNADECWRRLRYRENGVLATVHPERGVDAVPVVYGVTDDERIVLRIDTVKPKSTTRLQRLVNLELDPRCVLLVDRYDLDWSQLWWVRVHGMAVVVDDPPPAPARFDAEYAAPGSVVASMLLTPTLVTGWQA